MKRPTVILTRSLIDHKEFVSALAFFIIMLLAFLIANPRVWLSGHIYSAILTTFPQYSLLAVALVFVIASREIDLSFASVLTLASYVFAVTATAGVPIVVAMGLAIVVAVAAECVGGVLVSYTKLPSFVVTLGMFYLWDGLVNILANGNGIGVQGLSGSGAVSVVTGEAGGIPAQALWAFGFALLGIALLARRRFGSNVVIVGDNAAAAESTGIRVARVKLGAFAFVGLAAGMVGILVTLVNLNFYPGTGDGLQLPALAAVFVGGTPLAGGAGTVAGAFVGSLTVAFIQTGIVTSGLSGFYTQFVFGIVIVLSIVILRVMEEWPPRAASYARLFRRGVVAVSSRSPVRARGAGAAAAREEGVAEGIGSGR